MLEPGSAVGVSAVNLCTSTLRKKTIDDQVIAVIPTLYDFLNVSRRSLWVT